MKALSAPQRILLIGDTLVMAVITGVGFASHAELGSAGWRLLTTFLPFLVAWMSAASLLKLYDVNVAATPGGFWRVVLAAVFAAPLAGWLRGIWLWRPVVPLFVLIMAGTLSLGMLVWRGVYGWQLRRKRLTYG